MAKGTKIIRVRAGEAVDLGDGDGPLPLDVLIEREVYRLRTVSDGAIIVQNVSDWVRRAIIRDLQHSRRSRRGRRKPAAADAASVATPCTTATTEDAPEEPRPLESRITPSSPVEPAEPAGPWAAESSW